MDKIRDINQYKETITSNADFFKQYYYHSLIDLNLTKLDLILQYGLLCKRLLEQTHNLSLYTHQANDYDSKNGSDYISLTEYKDDCAFCTMFESFPLHTMTSVSVLVDKDIRVFKQGARETFFDDEVFAQCAISQSKLKGILLPSHLTNLPINQVNCLPNDLSCYTRRYIDHWIDCMENYFERKIPRKIIEESREQLWTILEDYESPEKWIQSAVQYQRKIHGKDIKDVMAQVLYELWQQKLKIQNPTCIDVIRSINKQELPVFELQPTCLKKIM